MLFRSAISRSLAILVSAEMLISFIAESEIDCAGAAWAAGAAGVAVAVPPLSGAPFSTPPLAGLAV